MMDQPTQEEVNGEQILRSINTINSFISKISHTAPDLPSDDPHVLDTQADREFVQELRAKLNRMKVPMHHLHVKNKLSTVIEESHSEQTSARFISPREYGQDKLHHQETAQGQVEVGVERMMNKKITGIRKSNIISEETIRKETEKISIPRPVEEHHSQEQLELTARTDNQASSASKSKNRKGLTLLSKDKIRHDKENTAVRKQQINLVYKDAQIIDGVRSAEKEQPRKKLSKNFSAKINPFLQVKKSEETVKKSAGTKIKTCLSRTNLRDFYTSKRIKV